MTLWVLLIWAYSHQPMPIGQFASLAECLGVKTVLDNNREPNSAYTCEEQRL